MLTYKGYRYNGNDQDFIKKLMDDIAELQRTVARLIAQSKTETRIPQ